MCNERCKREQYCPFLLCVERLLPLYNYTDTEFINLFLSSCLLPSLSFLLTGRAERDLPRPHCHHHQAGLQPGHPFLRLHEPQEVVSGRRQQQGHWQHQNVPHRRHCWGCQRVWEYSSGCSQDSYAGIYIYTVIIIHDCLCIYS